MRESPLKTCLKASSYLLKCHSIDHALSFFWIYLLFLGITFFSYTHFIGNLANLERNDYLACIYNYFWGKPPTYSYKIFASYTVESFSWKHRNIPVAEFAEIMRDFKELPQLDCRMSSPNGKIPDCF